MADSAESNPLESGGPESATLIRALAAHPEQMAHLIEVLHSRVVDAATLLDLFGRLSREAVRVLDGVRWAGITAQFDDGYPLTAAHTDTRVLIVDERQYAFHDGPCLRAMRTGAVVRMNLAQVLHDWPDLGETATEVGVRSFLAMPLHSDGRFVGALNLYSAGDRVPEPDPDLLLVLTEYAGRGLTDYENSRPHPTAEQALRHAQADRTTVSHALGVLMHVHGFDEGYAREVLLDQAQDWGRTVPAQAAYILADNAPTG